MAQEAGKLKQGSHTPRSLGSSTNALQEIQPVAGPDPGKSEGGVNCLLVILLSATFVGYCSIGNLLYARSL